ncbi:hypothetical protein C2E23DRAFT_832516 [Lenzites betulinus]|nr:hypothetical protein C2E23DRAFT_832516 [Lenzites betulinus]
METVDNVPATRPRIWQCNWFWCPKMFRERSELAEHLEQVHFNNIVAVKTQYWNDYLRASQGLSGGSDRWKVNVTSQSTVETNTQTTQDSSSHNLTPQLSPTSDTSLKPRAPIPRNLPRPPAGSQQAQAASQPTTTRPQTSPKRPFVDSEGSSPHRGSQPGASSQSPASIASSSSESRLLKRRRTASFASCAAQSSPMSTPSVTSMPPSPALSNMITDAINASGRINAGTHTPSPDKTATARGLRPFPHSPLSNGTDSSRSGNGVAPIPRRTHRGVSPTPSGPRSLANVLNNIPGSPKPALRATPSIHGPGLMKGVAHIRSPAATSVASAQAVEDALTQMRSPSSRTSPAQSHSTSQVWSTSQAGSQNNIGTSESQTTSSSAPTQHPPSSQLSAELGSYRGSHAVESDPLAHSQFAPGAQSNKSATDSSPSRPVQTIAPIPRTNRSRIPAQSQSQSQTQSQRSPPPPAAVAPIPRTLRSRSKTPAPAAPLPPPSQRAPIPRRTTRSRASSLAPTPNASAGPNEGGSKKRASSKPPSVGPERRSSRARSKPPSVGTATAAGAGKATAGLGGLPAVEEQPDDDSNGAATGPRTVQSQSGDSLAAPSESHSGAGFRSGKLYVPLPRRTRARSHGQTVPGSSQLPNQSQTHSQSPVKEEPGDGFPMDVDHPPPRSQPVTQAVQARGDDEGVDSSQGSGGGYVEGYGFDMGSIVLQTQAPYKWSQTPSP